MRTPKTIRKMTPLARRLRHLQEGSSVRYVSSYTPAGVKYARTLGYMHVVIFDGQGPRPGTVGARTEKAILDVVAPT